MKKIIALTLTAFLIGSPIAFAHAQTVDNNSQSTVNIAALQQLLTLLLTELALLEQEYNQLAQAQASSTVQVAQIQGEIGTAASTTNFVAVTPAPTSTLPQLQIVAPQVVQTVVTPSLGSAQAPAPIVDPTNGATVSPNGGTSFNSQNWWSGLEEGENVVYGVFGTSTPDVVLQGHQGPYMAEQCLIGYNPPEGSTDSIPLNNSVTAHNDNGTLELILNPNLATIATVSSSSQYPITCATGYLNNFFPFGGEIE